MAEKSINLFYRDGGSDKVYQVQLEKKLDGFVVNFQYGRRGSSLQSGTKTNTPVSLNKAEEIYSKLVSEKTGKGYTPDESGSLYQGTDKAGQVSGLVPQLLNPIDEARCQELISDDAWLMEEKLDGFHQMAQTSSDGIVISNRKGLIVAASKAIENGLNIGASAIFDGETIGDVYHIFDMLEHEGKDLRNRPALDRLLYLTSYFINFENEPAIQLVPYALDTEKKAKLFVAVKAARGEGVVFKKKDSLYVPGRPNSGGNMLKFKFVQNATCYVFAQNDKRSVRIALRTSPLQMVHDSVEGVEVGNVTIPVNYEIPPVGSFIEVQYLYAFPGGSLFQTVYKGPRPDKDEADLYSTLKFKQGTVEEDA